MVDPIPVDSIPDLTDRDLLAAEQRTDGEGKAADALLSKIARRDLDC